MLVSLWGGTGSANGKGSAVLMLVTAWPGPADEAGVLAMEEVGVVT
jgi:hypothetical protein